MTTNIKFRSLAVGLLLALLLASTASTLWAQEEDPAAQAISELRAKMEQEFDAIASLMESGALGGFAEDSIWLAILLTAVGGCLGGLVYELLSLQGNIELPHAFVADEVPAEGEPQIASYALPGNMYDLDIWARLVVGALAAVAALLVLTPTAIHTLLGMSILTGSAGASIFDSLRARILATVAQADAAVSRIQNEQMQQKLNEVDKAFQQAKEAVIVSAESPVGTRELVFSHGAVPAHASDILEGEGFEPPRTVDLALFDQVEKLIYEAKGIGQAGRVRVKPSRT